MESVCIGGFLLILLLAVIVIAYPVSLVIGAITYAVRKSDQYRFPQAVVITIFTFLFVVILGCIVVWIWNPQF
jgi:hypothetical protein